MKLRGDRCQCCACKAYFNSTYAFDKHRTGIYSHDLTSRRCLTIPEMIAKGMSLSAKGFWITSKRPILPSERDEIATIDKIGTTVAAEDIACEMVVPL